LFNPLLGASIGIGLIQWARERNKNLIRWLFFAAFLLILPGILTRQVESKRIILIFPILIIAAGTGIQVLVSCLFKSPQRRTILTGILLVCTTLLDFYHYFVPFQDWNSFASNPNHWTSIEVSRAYFLLDSAVHQGKRYRILSHLGANFKDRNFEVAVSPLNASHHPEWPPGSIDGIELLTNINYRPFLEKRFPDSRWILLGPEFQEPGGGLMEGIIPYNGSTRVTLDNWTKADGEFKPILDAYSYVLPHQSLQTIVNQLWTEESKWESDPFLKSTWGERIADFTFLDPSLGTPRTLQALTRAVTGYPAAHLYNDMGLLWVAEGNKSQAEKCWRLALEAPLNQTSAGENLRFMESLGSAVSQGGVPSRSDKTN
jgi:hypothetical protein